MTGQGAEAQVNERVRRLLAIKGKKTVMAPQATARIMSQRTYTCRGAKVARRESSLDAATEFVGRKADRGRNLVHLPLQRKDALRGAESAKRSIGRGVRYHRPRGDCGATPAGHSPNSPPSPSRRPVLPMSRLVKAHRRSAA